MQRRPLSQPSTLHTAVSKIHFMHRATSNGWLGILLFGLVVLAAYCAKAEPSDVKLNATNILTSITVEYQVGSISKFVKDGWPAVLDGTNYDTGCLPKRTIYHQLNLGWHFTINGQGPSWFESGTSDGTSELVSDGGIYYTNCTGTQTWDYWMTDAEGDVSEWHEEDTPGPPTRPNCMASVHQWGVGGDGSDWDKTFSGEGGWWVGLLPRNEQSGLGIPLHVPPLENFKDWAFPNDYTINGGNLWSGEEALMSASTTFANEYTTAELLSKATNANTWSDSNPWTTGLPKLFFGLSEDEITCTNQVGRYRFKFIARKGQAYSFDYLVRFLPTDTNLTEQVEKHTVNGVGTGTVQYWPTPGTQDPLLYGKALVYTNNPSGCAVVAGGTNTLKVPCIFGGCAVCKTVGNCSAFNDSVRVTMAMGKDSRGTKSGELVIYSDQPSATLFTPAAINYFGDLDNAELLYNGSVLRQVKTGQQVLADITVLNSTSYQIAFYNNIWSKGSDGFYTFNGRTPFSTAVIQQRDSSINEIELVVQATTGDQTTYEYTWSDVDQGWTLNSAGLRKETRVKSSDDLTETDIIRNASDKVVYQEVDSYYVEPITHARFLSQKVVGANAENVATKYTYYDDSVNDPSNFGRVKMEVEPSGKWTRYDYDSDGRLTKETRQFLNSPTTADDTLCRIFEHDYTLLDGAIYSERIVEKLLGNEIGRSYFLRFADQTWDVQCQSPGAAWNAADNLTTITRYVTVDGESLPAQTLNPDGTMQICSYQSGAYRTNVVAVGQPDTTKTSIISGDQTVEVIDDTGLVIWSVTTNIDSGIMTAASTNTYDGYGRLIRTDYLGGTRTGMSYNCCGVSTETNIEGTITSYDYDDLKRRTTTTLNGISTIQDLDPLGHILSTVRHGTSGSDMLLSSAIYDTAGRMTSSTSALGYPTGYSYGFDANHQPTKTSTYPDTGTRVETYAQDGSLVTVTGTAVHPVKYDYGIAADNGANRFYTKETKLDGGGAVTQECQTTYSDMVRRKYKLIHANGASSLWAYNNKGQLTASTDKDGVTTLYAYNGRGELEYTAIDVNHNGHIDFAGSDRITKNVNDVIVNDFGSVVFRTQNYIWNRIGQDSAVLNVLERSADGLSEWEIGPKGRTSNRTVLNGNGQRTVTIIAPDGSYKTSVYIGNLLQSISIKDSSDHPISETTYGYDAYGRQNTTTDARNGTTTYQFNNADQRTMITRPSPDGIQPSPVLTNFYDHMGRLWCIADTGGVSVTNEFYCTGELNRSYGGHQYPVQKNYDPQGRLAAMTTWKNFAADSGAAVTKWIYDCGAGYLRTKTYDGNQYGPTYSYSSDGKLQMRSWARGGSTAYSYNGAGEVATITHNDSTPNVAIGYNRIGSQETITNGDIITTRLYNDVGLLTSESYSGGPLDGITVTNCYDQFQRRKKLSVLTQPAIVTEFSYDNGSRLSTVSYGVNSATYAYVPNSSLVDNISFAQNGVARLTMQNTFDHLDRLVNVTSTASGVGVSSFTYGFNSAGERSAVTNLDNTYWLYNYDNLGQLTSGKKYWSDGIPVAGQQFAFSFDDIGNRTNALAGGNQSGGKLRRANYLNNNLNQIISRTVPGAVDVIGTACSAATVTINSQRGYRRSDYFQNEVAVLNSANAVYPTITALAVLNSTTTSDTVSTNIGRVFVPRTPESFQYDSDGNLTSDGRFDYTWDSENRLTRIQSHADGPPDSKIQIDLVYDFLGRRIQKTVSTWNGSTYVLSSRTKFVYDGWNLVAELDSANRVIRSYTWGSENSGVVQVGRAGGLLFMTDYSSPVGITYFYGYDGHGNVVQLIRSDNSQVQAYYEYGPFGELIRASGPMVQANPFRFATKYQDDETGLDDYGYRFYNSSTGRWLSRDPIGEAGGRNLYGFVNENPVNEIDFRGLMKCGVLSFIVRYSKDNFVHLRKDDPTDPISYVTWHVAWDVVFKRGGNYDPRCCEFKQMIAGESKLIREGKDVFSDPITKHDDNYSRSNDSRSSDLSSVTYSASDDPEMPTPAGAQSGDTVDLQLTATDIIYGPGGDHAADPGSGQPACSCETQPMVAQREHTVHASWTAPNLNPSINETVPFTIAK